jgi:ParB/RepB/Spo0J family partition protein
MGTRKKKEIEARKNQDRIQKLAERHRARAAKKEEKPDALKVTLTPAERQLPLAASPSESAGAQTREIEVPAPAPEVLPVGQCLEMIQEDLPGCPVRLLKKRIPYIGPRHQGVNLADYYYRQVYLHPEMVINDPDQPRTEIDTAKLNELAESIKASGQTLTGDVYPLPGQEPILGMILDSERRWLACQQNGMPLLANIVEDIPDKTEKRGSQLRANHHKEAHTVLDNFHNICLLHDAGKTNDKIALEFGWSTATISSYLQLRKLEPEVLAMLDAKRPRNKQLPLLTAVELAARVPRFKQLGLAQAIIERRLGLQAVKLMIARLQGSEEPSAAGHRLPHTTEAFERLLRAHITLSNTLGLFLDLPEPTFKGILANHLPEEISHLLKTMDETDDLIAKIKKRLIAHVPKP